MKPVLAILGLAVAFILISVLLAGPKDQNPRPQDKQGQSNPQAPESSAGKPATPSTTPAGDDFKPPREGVMTADLTIKDVGTLTAEFYPKAAPNAVKQITGLIKSGFYDGILIHRVEKPVVVQFGRPLTKTQGMSAPETDGGVPELTYEDNNLPHVPGAIGLARKSDKNTATCQLFIDLQPMSQWNGEYCVIGRIVKGMDLLPKIEVGNAITSFKLK